ncbi:AMP-dependent synthetase/ligase [Canibacter zhoujuaniae]|uniref:AMP-dependent synthetase/ligase n=1 Tax=Canibacter zhoujuaniae TaxID=2708343 RepID=UPI001422B771|nr:AMP-dependent synthetase/ligase [Canibacter zhoujuaniae]
MKSTKVELLTDLLPDENLTYLLESRVAETPDRALFSIPEGSAWRDVTALEFHKDVIALAKGFVAAGIHPGEGVALMCKTRYEWTLIDFAAAYAGAFVIPIYETSSALQTQWILSDSGAVAIITENADHAARFNEIKSETPEVREHWRLDENILDDLRKQGAAVPDAEINHRRSIAKGADTATLIYTSGSFGRPKGCVITHSNFVDLSTNTMLRVEEVFRQEGAATLLFIPLAHVFARLISVLAVYGGIRVGHAEPTNLVDALGSFQPTFLLAVPRVFEKVYNGAEQKAEASGKGKIFRTAARTGVEYSRALDKGKVPLGLQLKFKLFDRLVFAKLRQALGGKVTYAVSGSAPLSSHLGHFYRALGVKILEGYGLTETTAPLSVNLPSKLKIGSVGPVLPGTEVRLGEDDEILVKGIGVFKEYWNNEEQTKAAFTEDGFFHTGDLGEIDEDGYIKITGRKKEIIITAGGKNVAPMVLEDPIRSNTIIAHPVVVGEKRQFISCLITLDPEMLPKWLENNGEDPNMSLADAAKHPKVIAEVQRTIDEANKFVSRAESIREFRILPVEFTEDSGHLTPKMSIKRANILKDFNYVVEEIYGPRPHTGTIGTVQS